MGWLYLLIVILLGTAIWPIARWTLAENGNPRVMGFWVSLTVCLASLVFLLSRKAPLYNPQIWAAGVVFALAYAIGFNILIMRCLQVGPTGPTVTLNNSAMIFGVLYGVLWLNPQFPNPWVLTGITGVFLALALIGFGGNRASSRTQDSKNQWLPLVLAGAAFSGLSFISQTYVGVRHPGIDNSLLFAFVGFGLSATILLISLTRKPLALKRHKRELYGGIILGLVNAVSFPLTILAFKHVGVEIVLPVSVTSPMVLILFIGSMAYGERLNRLTWAGCALAVLSVGAIGYGSTLKPEASKTQLSLLLQNKNHESYRIKNWHCRLWWHQSYAQTRL